MRAGSKGCCLVEIEIVEAYILNSPKIALGGDNSMRTEIFCGEVRVLSSSLKCLWLIDTLLRPSDYHSSI